MTAARRLAAASSLLAGLALAADLYGPARLAIALTAATVLLIAVTCMVLAQPKDRQP